MELAVFSDCRALVEHFVKKGNPRFHAFCTQWKQMMFQHIYSAQSTSVEVLQTTAAAFYIAKRIVCCNEMPSYTGNTTGIEDEEQVLRRIGGLYLMYAIYFKQPTKEYAKVEMTMEAWQRMRAFIVALPPSMPTDDVHYIFWKLLQSNAFRFTALDFCVGLEYLVDYDKVDEEQGAEPTDIDIASAKLRQELPAFKDTQAIIPSLAVLEEGYNEMKEILASTTKSVDTQALPPTTIFSEIQNAFKRIGEILGEPQRKEIAEKTEAEPKSEQESKRRSLKRKGYNVELSGNAIAIDATKLKQDSGSTAANSRAHRRMSARTVFAEQLPKALLDDLEDATVSEDAEGVEKEADVTNNPLQTSAKSNAELSAKSLGVINIDAVESDALVEELLAEATRE